MSFELLLPTNKKELQNFVRSIKEFLNQVKEIDGNLKKINLKDLIAPPQGYALRIIEDLENAKRDRKKKGLTRVQLRKIFNEITVIYQLCKNYEADKKEEDKRKILINLYKLYPLLEYQENRGLIDPDIKYLFWNLLQCVELDLAQIEIVKEFVNALVAYIPKES